MSKQTKQMVTAIVVSTFIIYGLLTALIWAVRRIRGKWWKQCDALASKVAGKVIRLNKDDD